MSATATISTPTIDRVGDLLVPSGCVLTDYEKNPVVLYGHGLESIVLPIGTSRNPTTGELAVDVSDSEVKATCWFSQKSLQAEQIFELIDEGIIRATSVRETPLQTRREFRGREPYTLVESYSLEEWSWCSIGVNPDAVAKAINGRVAGKRLHESICKSLTAQLPPRRKNGLGFTPKTKLKDETMDEDEDEGTGEEMKSADTGSVTKPDDDDKTDMETPAEDVPGAEEADTDNDDPSQQPYGQQYLAACHAKLKDCHDEMSKHFGANEHPDVKEGMQKCMDCLKDQMTNIQGLHDATYPEAKTKLSLQDDIEGGKPAGLNDDKNDSALKAFLASGQAGYRAQGIVAQLKSLASQSNLKPSQRRVLIELAGAQERLLNEAKASSRTKSRKPATKDEQARIAAAIAALSN